MFGEIATFFSFICLKAPGFFSVTVFRFLHGLIYFLSIDSQKDIDFLNTLWMKIKINKDFWVNSIVKFQKVSSVTRPSLFCPKTKESWLYVLVMSRTRFRVNLHSIIVRMSRNSLLAAGAKSEVLSDCNWTQTHNH